MIEIIPAIDLIGGECVRLLQGDYEQKTVYSKNPVEVAKVFQNAGIRRLHLVDLDGAKVGELMSLKVLESIAAQTSLTIDFGGGIASEADVEAVYNAGAEIATIGSVAIKQPEKFLEWIAKYTSDRMLLAADVRNDLLAIAGWKETTSRNIFDYLQRFGHQELQFFCTDINKDGRLAGPSFDLYKRLIMSFPHMKVIASGGVADIKDIAMLEKIGCSGVIIGKALYEGRITLDQLQPYLH